MPGIHPDATSPSGPTAWHFQCSIASIASSFVRVNDRRFAVDELRGWCGRAKWCLLRSCNLRQAIEGGCGLGANRLRRPWLGRRTLRAGRCPTVLLDQDAHHFPVVFRLHRQGNLDSACSVDAPTAAAAGIAFILAGPHLRVFRAQRADFRRKRDRRFPAHAAGFGDADIDGTGRHNDGRGGARRRRPRRGIARDGWWCRCGNRAPYDGGSRGIARCSSAGQGKRRPSERHRQESGQATQTHRASADSLGETIGLGGQGGARQTRPADTGHPAIRRLRSLRQRSPKNDRRAMMMTTAPTM